MDVFGTTMNQDVFASALQGSMGLESLAGSALQRGIDAYTGGDYETAVREFKRSAGLGRYAGYGVESYQYLAMAYLKLEDPENAVKAYQSAIQIDHSRDDTHVSLGNLYFAQQKYEDARAEYAEAVRINPSTVNRYSLGQAYIELGRFSDAETQYNEIQRLAPQDAGSYLGMGMAYSRQGRYEDAIAQFKQAISRNGKLYDAYAEMGYAYADMGDMESSQRMVDWLEKAQQSGLSDTLSRYMFKVDPPKITLAHSTSTFPFHMLPKTPVSGLSSYLSTPNTSKTFSVKFQFDKAMDLESVQNPLNWRISRATGQGPGQAYNYGLSIAATEIKLAPVPTAVSYNPKDLTATVYFTVTQNAAANATIDPSHIEFKFSGKDIYGLKINPKFDQFTGFSGVV